MIASALGWDIERIEETREPILSRTRREAGDVTVEPGCAAGCLHTAVAHRAGRAVITLIHPQQVHPHLEGVQTGDRIRIEGAPDLCLESRPEIPGGQATAALAVTWLTEVLVTANVEVLIECTTEPPIQPPSHSRPEPSAAMP